MNQREQINFYLHPDRDHWRYMDMSRMKDKLSAWIKNERSVLKAQGIKSNDTLSRLLKVRYKVNYYLRNGIKGYDVGKYEFK